MRSITLSLPGATSAALDGLLARLRREAGSAPNRYEFLEDVFSRAVAAEIVAEDARLDALAKAARERAATSTPGKTELPASKSADA